MNKLLAAIALFDDRIGHLRGSAEWNRSEGATAAANYNWSWASGLQEARQIVVRLLCEEPSLLEEVEAELKARHAPVEVTKPLVMDSTR